MKPNTRLGNVFLVFVVLHFPLVWYTRLQGITGKKELSEPCVDNRKNRSVECTAKLTHTEPLVRARDRFTSCHLDWGLEIKSLEYAMVQFLKLVMP